MDEAEKLFDLDCLRIGKLVDFWGRGEVVDECDGEDFEAHFVVEIFFDVIVVV